MAISKRHRYKTRREKYENNIKIMRMLLLFVTIALALLAFKNRVWIYDWITIWLS
jgi:hypothetical protein